MLTLPILLRRVGYPVYRKLSVTSLSLKGHSKWDNIVGDKTKSDAIRSLKISSYMKRIKSCVKEGGFDLNVNSRLSDLRKQYKADCLPLDTFDANLLKIKNNPDVTLFLNFTGPSDSLFIVEFEAESKYRIQRDVNKHLKKMPDFRLTTDLAETYFQEKGVIVIKAVSKEALPIKLEQVEEVGIELECEDVQSINEDQNGDMFELICAKTHLSKIETELERRGYQIVSADVQFLPFETISLTEKDNQAVNLFYKELHEMETVKSIFDNIEHRE